MKTIKLAEILSVNDFDDNHVLIFDENNKFIGFVIFTGGGLCSTVCVRADDCTMGYSTIPEFLSSYEEYTLKLVSNDEMHHILESSLFPKPHKKNTKKMKIFKIPNLDDIKDKYAILLTKDYDFLGFVHYDKEYDIYEVIHGDQTESYDNITELWENNTADVIGILTPEEMSDIFKNILTPKI